MRNKKSIVLTICIAILLSGFYFPHLLYVAFKFELMRKPSVGGFVINMADGWFPVVSSETKLGQLFLGNPTSDTVAYAHISGGMPGADLWVVFSSPDLTFKNDHSWKSRSVLNTESYSWGTAYIIKPEIIRSTNPNYAVFDEYNLTATSPDLMNLRKALAGIISIQTK